MKPRDAVNGKGKETLVTAGLNRSRISKLTCGWLEEGLAVYSTSRVSCVLGSVNRIRSLCPLIICSRAHFPVHTRRRLLYTKAFLRAREQTLTPPCTKWDRAEAAFSEFQLRLSRLPNFGKESL